jgi:hexosaminidase
MNTFHWHLADDQGWRVEIKKLPKLTEIGSKFSPQHKGERNGYFTQEDVKEVVQYAADRHITVVPEFAMPGHVLALLAAYLELSCTGGPSFEIFPYMSKPVVERTPIDVLCVGNDKALEVVKTALSEIVELFPSPYIHIGGDECPTARWNKCVKCQARVKAEGLKDESQLETWFVNDLAKFLESKNKRLAGWDEIILGGNLTPRAVVTSWRGIAPGIAAAKAGNDVVMSPAMPCYLDHLLSDPKVTPQTIYAWDPIPPQYCYELSEALPAEAAHILGAQVNMWTHIARDEDGISQQIWPRVVSMAEVTWTPKDSRDWSRFSKNLKDHCERFDRMGVKYYRYPSIWAND